jgi:hypothetical protein
MLDKAEDCGTMRATFRRLEKVRTTSQPHVGSPLLDNGESASLSIEFYVIPASFSFIFDLV